MRPDALGLPHLACRKPLYGGTSHPFLYVRDIYCHVGERPYGLIQTLLGTYSKSAGFVSPNGNCLGHKGHHYQYGLTTFQRGVRPCLQGIVQKSFPIQGKPLSHVHHIDHKMMLLDYCIDTSFATKQSTGEFWINRDVLGALSLFFVAYPTSIVEGFTS